jgi:hypothetical protein
VSREKQGFREVLAALNEMFPDKGMLKRSDVARFLGRSVRTTYRLGIKFNDKTGLVAKADLARQICI